MTDKMDRGLDEIIADNRSNKPRNNRRGGGGRQRERQDRSDRQDRQDRPERQDRQDYPRDGVRKSYRNEPRSIDTEWVHDRYEESNSRRAPAPRRRHDDSADQDAKGTKVRVDNVHYDLTEGDLEELFERIGKVVKLQLRYDRAGRSEGTAFVVYESQADASEAVRQYNGANANGQPIRLSIMQSRNPFDTAVMPGKPLSERISAPGGRARSLSPQRRYDEDDAARKGIDRYIPGGGSRSRSPMPRRRGGGRRPGARREGAGSGREQESGRGGRGNPRGKKTQEELDAEMEDYFGGGGAPAADATPTAQGTTGTAPATSAAQVEDIDMIE